MSNFLLQVQRMFILSSCWILGVIYIFTQEIKSIKAFLYSPLFNTKRNLKKILHTLPALFHFHTGSLSGGHHRTWALPQPALHWLQVMLQIKVLIAIPLQATGHTRPLTSHVRGKTPTCGESQARQTQAKTPGLGFPSLHRLFWEAVHKSNKEQSCCCGRREWGKSWHLQ